MIYIITKGLIYQLSILKKKSLKCYKEQLKLSENITPLAYYFFDHQNLSKRVKQKIKTACKCFKEKYKLFTLDNLKNHFINLDITNSMTAKSLPLNLEVMKKLASFSFEIKKKTYLHKTLK